MSRSVRTRPAASRRTATRKLAPELAISHLKRHLPPAAGANREEITRLIADLDSNQFAVREAASKKLADLGGPARPLLRRALEGAPALETRRRLEQLQFRQHFRSCPQFRSWGCHYSSHLPSWSHSSASNSRTS